VSKGQKENNNIMNKLAMEQFKYFRLKILAYSNVRANLLVWNSIIEQVVAEPRKKFSGSKNTLNMTNLFAKRGQITILLGMLQRK
jgi:hypothetical protein